MMMLGPMRRQRPLPGRPCPAWRGAAGGMNDIGDTDDIGDVGDIAGEPFNSPGA
jgi:hypothetical protein